MSQSKQHYQRTKLLEFGRLFPYKGRCFSLLAYICQRFSLILNIIRMHKATLQYIPPLVWKATYRATRE